MYGAQEMIINVYSLIHLADGVRVASKVFFVWDERKHQWEEEKCLLCITSSIFRIVAKATSGPCLEFKRNKTLLLSGSTCFLVRFRTTQLLQVESVDLSSGFRKPILLTKLDIESSKRCWIFLIPIPNQLIDTLFIVKTFLRKSSPASIAKWISNALRQRLQIHFTVLYLYVVQQKNDPKFFLSRWRSAH